MALALPPILAVVLLLVAYILGHAVAHAASTILESGLVFRLLGAPESVLLSTEPSASVWRFLFPGYYKPLPQDTRTRIRTLAEEQNAPRSDRAMFLYCHAIVRQQPATLERLNIFLSLYGFCRNLAMAVLIAALLLVAARLGIASLSDESRTRIGLPHFALLFVLFYVLLLRYLKFIRLYTIEVFTAYAVTKV